MGYGVSRFMGYGFEIPAYQVGGPKKPWGIRGYGLYPGYERFNQPRVQLYYPGDTTYLSARTAWLSNLSRISLEEEVGLDSKNRRSSLLVTRACTRVKTRVIEYQVRYVKGYVARYVG